MTQGDETVGARRGADAPKYPGRVLGAVLAGGRSTRFGRDKAEEPIASGTPGEAAVSSLERVREVLRSVADRVVVIGGPHSEVAEPAPGEGPLQAVVAALRAARDGGCERVTVLACDLPWLDRATVERLSAPLTDRELGRVPRVAGRLQVLAATWSASALPALEEAMARGERSLTRWVMQREDAFAVSDDWVAAALSDFDTPEDLARGHAEAARRSRPA